MMVHSTRKQSRTRTATDPQAKQKTERVSLSKGWTLTIALGLIVIVGVVTGSVVQASLISAGEAVAHQVKAEDQRPTSSRLTNRSVLFPQNQVCSRWVTAWSLQRRAFVGKPHELFYNNWRKRA
jgi:hypothetical protein